MAWNEDGSTLPLGRLVRKALKSRNGFAKMNGISCRAIDKDHVEIRKCSVAGGRWLSAGVVRNYSDGRIWGVHIDAPSVNLDALAGIEP